MTDKQDVATAIIVGLLCGIGLLWVAGEWPF